MDGGNIYKFKVGTKIILTKLNLYCNFLLKFIVFTFENDRYKSMGRARVGKCDNLFPQFKWQPYPGIG